MEDINYSGEMKCLFCGQKGENVLLQGHPSTLNDDEGNTEKVVISPSCAVSLCSIFGFKDDHPFRKIYESSFYCKQCFKEIRKADVLLGELEILRQNLIRFQHTIYSKIGDNYFRINDLNSLSVSNVELDKGVDLDGVKARSFTYDHHVKMIYEKLDSKNCNWEQFTSANQSHCTTGGGDSKEYCDKSTSTLAKSPRKSSLTERTYSNSNLKQDVDDLATRGIVGEKLKQTVKDRLALASLSFTQTPENLLESQKIYCSHDPENCKRYFYDLYNLEIHVKSFHLGISKPHECDICKRCFIDEKRLRNHHLRVHLHVSSAHPPASFICELCGKDFKDHRGLQSHIRSHHNNEETGRSAQLISCKFCDARYESPKELRKHEKQHTVMLESPFGCVFCPRILTHSKALKTHTKQAHSSDVLFFSCRICNRSFAKERSLQLHLKTHTGTGFRCDQCSFNATSISALKSHKISHSSEKLYTCDLCGARYKYLKNLNAHVKSHTDTEVKNEVFTCPICSKTFRNRTYLKRHEESHSKESNYCCYICGMGFKVEENFRKHERLQTCSKNAKKIKSKILKRKAGKAVTESGKVGVIKGKRKSRKTTANKSISSKVAVNTSSATSVPTTIKMEAIPLNVHEVVGTGVATGTGTKTSLIQYQPTGPEHQIIPIQFNDSNSTNTYIIMQSVDVLPFKKSSTSAGV